MTRLLLFGLWVISSAAPARASDLDLQWLAPDRTCPDREELRRGLARRLQREVTLGSDAAFSLRAQVAAEGAGYVLELGTSSDRGSERRVLRARTCNELARASVLFASLLFSRQPPVSKARPAEEEPAAKRVYARVQLVADLGSLPGLALGPGVMLGFAFGPGSIELGGFALPSQVATASTRGDASASLQLTAAAAVGCVRVLRFAALSPCLHLEAGVLHAAGRNFETARSVDRLWLLAGAGLRAGFALSDWLYWLTEVSAGLPWDRAQFLVGEVGEVHSVPSVIGRLTTGFESRF